MRQARCKTLTVNATYMLVVWESENKMRNMMDNVLLGIVKSIVSQYYQPCINPKIA